MSDDPETARQIAELANDQRPLLVVDVDEVVLEFVDPFIRFLNSQGMTMLTDSFRIHGNVVRLEDGAVADADAVSILMTEFFDVQGDWQVAAPGVVDALESLSRPLEIVLLSAMPHRHRPNRRALLDSLGLSYPLVSTEAPKGPAVRQLRGGTGRSVAFIDDIPRNLMSVSESVPDASLFHLMSHAELRELLPPLPDGVTSLEGWHSAGPAILAALGIPHNS
jgi:hypothetical protein